MTPEERIQVLEKRLNTVMYILKNMRVTGCSGVYSFIIHGQGCAGFEDRLTELKPIEETPPCD